jgi:hypothetical protein
MSRRRTDGIGIAFEQRLRRRIVLVAGAILILIGSVSSVPSASATLMGVTDTVGSAVESVDAASNAAPSLPSTMPPAPPPAPVAIPPAPQAPVKLHTETAPTPSPSPSRSGVNVPSVDGIASAARNPLGSVTSTGKEATQQVAASARSDDSRVSTPPNGSGAGASKAIPRAIGTPSSAPPSIRAAEMAALQRWFARVWPAIPLGGGAGRGWAAGVIGDLFRPAAAAAARLLVLAPLVVRAASDSPFVGQPGTANAPQPALPNAPVSADGKKVIYLVVLAALLAFLAFTIWREFRSALRPGVRW